MYLAAGLFIGDGLYRCGGFVTMYEVGVDGIYDDSFDREVVVVQGYDDVFGVGEGSGDLGGK